MKIILRLSSIVCCYFLVLLSGSTAFYAQSVDVSHQVITFDGKEYMGTLLHYQPGELLHLRLADGEDLFLSADAVKRINKLSEKTENAKKRRRSAVSPQDSKMVALDKSLTIQISGGTSFGRLQSPNNFQPSQQIIGYTAALALHHRLGAHFQVGGGIDYFSFSPTARENSIGAFARLRGLTSKRAKSLFVQVEGGYGLPIASQAARLTAKQGGPFLHPAIGYVFKQTAKAPELSIDFGYRITEQTRTFVVFNGEQTQSTAYRRAALRLAVAF